MNTAGFVATSFPNRHASVRVCMEGHLSSCDFSLCISAFFTAGSDMVIVLVLIVNPKKSICFDEVRTNFGTLVMKPSDANSQMTVERCSKSCCFDCALKSMSSR